MEEQYEVDVLYRGADRSLAQPGRKQTRKHVRDARDFNNIETRAVINYFFLQGKAPKEIHTILTKTFACFFPGRVKDLSAPLYFLGIYSMCLQRSCVENNFIFLHVKYAVNESEDSLCWQYHHLQMQLRPWANMQGNI